MTLDTLGTQIDTIRDRTQPIKDTLGAAIERTRADTRITEATKRQEIAQHYLAAKSKLDALLTEERTITKNKHDELERSLFGQRDPGPAGIVSYRDAQDRALRLGPNDEDHALALLISARQSDDNTLATAILARGVHFKWDSVVGAYTDAYPEQAERLKDLTDIQHWTTEHEDDGFNGYAGIYSVSTPREFAGLINDGAIQKIATPDNHNN